MARLSTGPGEVNTVENFTVWTFNEVLEKYIILLSRKVIIL